MVPDIVIITHMVDDLNAEDWLLVLRVRPLTPTIAHTIFISSVISMYIRTYVRTVEPLVKVTSVIQPFRHCGHPGIIPNYSHNSKIQDIKVPLIRSL